MHTILVTAFEPFDSDTVNPSAEAVRALAAAPPPGVALVSAVLPVSYARTLPALRDAIARHRPDIVIAVGQAGGRAEISVERVAINVDDGRIADNDGVRRIDAPVVEGGPAAYFATLPIKAMVGAMRAAGLPARVSQTAGTFLCNHVFYGLCHIAATERPRLVGGFIHVPYLPEQATQHPGQPSMALESIVAALRVAVLTGARVTSDLRVAEGATH